MTTRALRLCLALTVAFVLGLTMNGLAGEHGKGKGKGKGATTAPGDQEKGKGKSKGDAEGEGAGKGAQKAGDTTADQGKAKGQDADKERGPDSRPPGWDRGKKEGWRSEVPPGFDKLTDEQKTKWKQDLDDARTSVGRHAEEKGLKAEAKAKAQDAVEHAARKGVPIPKARDAAVEALGANKDVGAVLTGIEEGLKTAP